MIYHGTTQPTVSKRAYELAHRTEDAFSYDRFYSWAALAAALLRAGFDEREAEAVLRSKWTRWAADDSRARYGYATAKDLLAALGTKGAPVPGSKSLRSLVAETFDGVPSWVANEKEAARA